MRFASVGSRLCDVHVTLLLLKRNEVLTAWREKVLDRLH